MICVVWALISPGITNGQNKVLAVKIQQNEYFSSVRERAIDVVKSGFTAGEGYGQVWIRDYNTFIELSAAAFPKEVLKERLLVFFRLQGKDGSIVDFYISKEKAESGDYIHSVLEPRYVGFKNTVETDQESSLLQAVWKYIQCTKDESILNEAIGRETVAARMEKALAFLLENRLSKKYGLLWGATTADWGDVEPEQEWGVSLTKDSHLSIDVYDNAMFVIALDDFLKMVPAAGRKWAPLRKSVAKNIRRYLWDEGNQKFVPHVYLKESPFPAGFDENKIYYHGGTAIAIEAGLLTKAEVKTAVKKMAENVRASGAASIGLTLYPPYPQGYFKNRQMVPFGYQNGGDWTWFGGRMIQQLIRFGFVDEAYDLAQPMVERVIRHNGFHEWYSVENRPKGSGSYRGEAGVLYKTVGMFQEWAASQLESYDGLEMFCQ